MIWCIFIFFAKKKKKIQQIKQNKELIKMAEITEQDLMDYLRGNFDVGGYSFDINKEILFQHSKPHYRLSIHQKRYKAFESLCDLYNQKRERYIKNKTIPNTLEIYNTLKSMESSNSENATIFLSSQIQKEINSFRKLKVQFNTKLEGAKSALGKIKWFNIKEKAKIESALFKAKKALNNFKGVRKIIKDKAQSENIITSSTFIHSIINCKDGRIPGTLTGMLGSLVAAAYSIEQNNHDDKWKKLSLKEMIEIQKRLENGPKGYENSLKLFSKGAELAEKFENNKDKTTSNKDMNSAIKELKREIDKFFNEQLKILESKKRNSDIKSYAKKLKESFKTKKSEWVNRYEETFNCDEKSLEDFIDIYFQTISLAILNGTKGLYSKLDLTALILQGIFCIVSGAAMCITPDIPVGVFMIALGVAEIIYSLDEEFSTSYFKENARAFSEAASVIKVKEE